MDWSRTASLDDNASMDAKLEHDDKQKRNVIKQIYPGNDPTVSQSCCDYPHIY